MGAIWLNEANAPKGLPTGWLYRMRSSPKYAGALKALKSHIAPAVFAVMFAYLGFAVASHLLFNIQDVWGATCKESPKPLVSLAVNQTITLPTLFDTSEFCRATGIELKSGGTRYTITIRPKSDWVDAAVPVKPGDSSLETANWFRTILLYLGVPLRRELFEDWFTIAVRYGGIGGEEAFYHPDPTDPVIEFPLVPTRDGELFIFVNDAVLGIPGLYGLFYWDNSGTAEISLKRTK
jgi:hypothetical protein